MVTSTSLLTLGLYHPQLPQIPADLPLKTLPSSTLSPPPTTRFPNLPLHLTILFLLLSSLYHLFSSFSPDPLVPSYSLHSSAVSFLFLPLSSLSFFLSSPPSSSSSPSPSPSIQSHCHSISSLCSALCLFIALFPRAFFLAAALCLQGLWALQTALSLYLDAFIPEGCHRLLDVVAGVDGSTKCELQDSRIRAFALLDLAFVIHVAIVLVFVFLVFAVVSKALGVSRRLGSYEPLPTAAVDTNHVQLKTMSGTQA